MTKATFRKDESLTPQDAVTKTRSGEPVRAGGSAYDVDQTFRIRARRGLAFGNISAFYVLLLMVAIFGIWIPDIFLTPQNVRTILYESSVATVIAVGLVMPSAAGKFDASVGANAGLASVLIGMLIVDHQVPWVAAAMLTILVGAAVGLLNGLAVVRFQIQSIIATLGMMSILIGLATAVGNHRIIVGFPESFESLGSATFLGVAWPVYVLVAVAIVVWFVLERAAVGRRIYATGGGEETARLAGVRTRSIGVAVFVVSGAIASIGGILATARVGAAQAEMGPPFLLPAFAAVFLGATQLRGGRFNVWGTLLASFTLAVGVKGLTLGGAPLWLPEVFNGAALLVAVALTARKGLARAVPTH